ncbi:glycoside hydrolase superfamily [Paraphoma chrysanthemicola]|nr:glycoside hydrolase superfamily [Paraphoma chrysanthemicola]
MAAIFNRFLPLYITLLFALSLASGKSFDYQGVNIPGLEFRIDTNGAVSCAGCQPTYPSLDNLDSWLGLNATLIRIPVGWNYLQPNKFPTNALDPTIMGHLDELVQHITFNQKRKVYVVIDIHNYARYNKVIVGQEKARPFNYDLGVLWQLLAEHYKNNSQVMFGLMNEPHDLDIKIWAQTVQFVINQIRQVTTAQYILVPGTSWQALVGWTTESQNALSIVTDPAGKIYYDVHQYFDGNGGNNGYCNDFNSTFRNDFRDFASAMRSTRSKAILSEFGGNSTDLKCRTTVNDMLLFLENNADAFAGWTAWGTGLDTTERTFLDPANALRPTPSLENVIAAHMNMAVEGSDNVAMATAVELLTVVDEDVEVIGVEEAIGACELGLGAGAGSNMASTQYGISVT